MPIILDYVGCRYCEFLAQGRDPLTNKKVCQKVSDHFFAVFLGVFFLCGDPFTDCKVSDCPVEWVGAVQVHPLVVLWAEKEMNMTDFLME